MLLQIYPFCLFCLIYWRKICPDAENVWPLQAEQINILIYFECWNSNKYLYIYLKVVADFWLHFTTTKSINNTIRIFCICKRWRLCNAFEIWNEWERESESTAESNVPFPVFSPRPSPKIKDYLLFDSSTDLERIGM